QQIGEAAHNREPESHAAVRPLGRDVVSHLTELLEDPRLMFGPDADSGVDDFHRDARSAPSRTDNDPTAPRVSNGIGDEIPENAPFAVARASRQRSDIESQRMERLA